MADAPLVAVGEVLRPYGLQGEVKVRPLTDRPDERFRELRQATIRLHQQGVRGLDQDFRPRCQPVHGSPEVRHRFGDLPQP